MRIPKIHKLKVWLKYYTEIDKENKTFELRKNDRGFQVNDYLYLQPFDNDKDVEVQMGRQLAKITYVLTDAKEFGLMEGYAILGLKFWRNFTEEERLVFRLIEAGKINSEDKW
jgi:fructosamine-3-kinase